ncbi:MAG: CAP domain-containing protein [Armatimonadota bacterium]
MYLKRLVIVLCTACSVLSLSSGYAGLPGDVSNDGRLLIDDAQLALRGALGLRPLTEAQALAADVSPMPGKGGRSYGDGAVRVDDVLVILRMALGLAEPLEPPLRVLVEGNKTVVDWGMVYDVPVTVAFRQNGTSVTKIVRAASRLVLSEEKLYNGATGTFENDYMLFSHFAPDIPVTVSAMAGSKLLGSASVVPLAHMPSEHRTDWLAVEDEIPAAVTAGGTVTIRARTTQPVLADAYITPPSGMPQRVRITADPAYVTETPGEEAWIAVGASISLSFQVDQAGVYMLEINHPSGSAALNRPVYVGGVPLLPTYFDRLRPYSMLPLDLDTARSQWLTLVNGVRRLYGLRPLSVDPNLSIAAQAHANDMASRGYLGHVSPDGTEPQTRAQQAGAPAVMVVGENIALSSDVEGLHEGLMTSGAHRANILDASWSRVGLGIAKRSDGAFIGVQVFGKYPGEYDLPQDAFHNLRLDEPAPTVFYVGTPVSISGTATTETAQITVFFSPLNGGPQIAMPTASASQGRFSTVVSFSPGQQGEYWMGISVDGEPSAVYPVIVR